MKFQALVKYLASETKKSAKGNSYTISSFMQDGSADVLMCIDKSDSSYQFGEEYQAEFEYSPKFKSLQFIGVL